MRSCPSCGGIIGRDCFNPIECAQITASMNEQYAIDDYIVNMNRKAELARQHDAEQEYSKWVDAEIQEHETTQCLELSPVLFRFLKTI